MAIPSVAPTAALPVTARMVVLAALPARQVLAPREQTLAVRVAMVPLADPVVMVATVRVVMAGLHLGRYL